MREKMVYVTPKLTIHGKVEDLTQTRKRVGHSDGRGGGRPPGKRPGRGDGMGGRRPGGWS